MIAFTELVYRQYFRLYNFLKQLLIDLRFALSDGTFSLSSFWNTVQSKHVRVYEISFQFTTPSTKENILSQTMLGKNHFFHEVANFWNI